MAGGLERCRGRWYAISCGDAASKTYKAVGPAHAVYFATYEAVKQFMGGNKNNGHHPLAAGNEKWIIHIKGYC